MKFVQIEVTDEPKSFADVKFTKEDYLAAKKTGRVTVPMVTALQNVRLSHGLYRIVSDAKQVEVILKGLPSVSEMDGPALYAEMASHGKPPQKKMNMATAREFVEKLREKAAAMIVDEDE